jgi:hypothetical protein
MLIPAGVVDNSASAEADLFLSNDQKKIRLFLQKRFWFFIPIKLRRNQLINHPGRGKNTVYIR